ncbi:MAG: galactokinase [Gemmatimonadota bacterium]|nr:galactokinase [Gemmatimonadota bacterium]
MSYTADVFKAVFDRTPTHMVRSPGRVNLIGEHIDYAGLPVLPMAIDKDITIAFAPRQDNIVRVVNDNPLFSSKEFEVSSEIPHQDLGDWGNYLQAAAQGLSREFGISRGVDAAISSTLPIASGLSSSASLVIAIGLALLQANDISVDAIALAEILARAERYVGTQGGGMDQAIVLGAKPGSASYIHFNPLRLSATAVPTDWRFIVASSLVRAEKSGAAKDAYNERVRQTGEALQAVLRALDSESPGGGYPDLVARYRTQELVEVAEQNLSDTLFRRFMHVITEADRVASASEAMKEGDIETFGDLMSASHLSLKNDFEVSSDELDSLVAHAEEGGAVGARLTGAGFGGCIVALCEASATEEMLTYLSKTFYAQRDVTGPLDDLLFLANPTGGASVTAI